ncbi:MAG: hypothetical protein HOJ34_03070 [Kordiimonadaceae bacterium]|jgi:hypothetical protein|nr:hypothetical protein [Kordiimonadaceae bacterium]MBT6037160.1 hypothetical protein [Kordiimonadaceae bacterium]MBT6328741.1 hypothetical protein [Kordiimonadaceae bacterium]
MRFFLTVLILLAISEIGNIALAQENNAERVILITPSNCQLLTQHVPDADLAYQPGLDARGNKVTPADLENGSNLGLGANGYSFYMTHDALRENSIADKYGLGDAQEGKIILGQVTVKDGDVLWNGTSLKEADKNRIYLLCEEQTREKRRPIVKR